MLGKIDEIIDNSVKIKLEIDNFIDNYEAQKEIFKIQFGFVTRFDKEKSIQYAYVVSRPKGPMGPIGSSTSNQKFNSSDA